MIDFDQLDKLIHEKSRLSIMTLLATRDDWAFQDLKAELGLSDGNLITHMRTLVNAAYVKETYDETGSNGAQRSEAYACIFGFDGSGSFQLTYDLATSASRPNFRDYSYLSFRAAQASRHPNTTALLGDLTFSVTIEDAVGNQGTVNIGAYGGGIEEPYQRNIDPVCGTGSGWNSEYETIRIRLTDFLNNGSNVDLANARKVVFRFGPAHGSAQGRLAFDDIELTRK